MPYSRQSFFNPSDSYKKTWSLTPQGRTLTVSGHKTKSMYASLSSAIPIYYILMFLAIGFDIYLGFSILSKSGVSLGLIIGSVVADFFLAVLPFIIENSVSSLNHIVIENKTFQKKMECKTKLNGESDEGYYARKNNIINGELRELNSNKRKGSLLRLILIILILAIAGWKIYTYMSVVPPGLNIFSLVNGKIVIIFSILCAIFHIIGSEKAFSHFVFWMKKGSEFKEHNDFSNGIKPPKTSIPIVFVGEFKNAMHQNTEVEVSEDGTARINYINIIWDDEIKALIDAQEDENAKRAVAITCKQTQIF